MPGGARSQPSCQPAADRCLHCPGEAAAQPRTGALGKGSPPQHCRSPHRDKGPPRGCHRAPSKGRGWPQPCRCCCSGCLPPRWSRRCLAPEMVQVTRHHGPRLCCSVPCGGGLGVGVGHPMPVLLMAPLFSHPEDLKALQVSIPRHPALDAVLAGDITIPCLITYLGPQPTAGTAGRRAVLGTPRVKWTFISEGREVEILVARGDRVKVSEDYRLRASLPIFHQRYTNASLLLTELRPNDSGIYRCDVQHGIEDGHDILDVKVKGVVFHYREGSMRYAYTFAEALEACARIGARIATPEQLYAAYLGGYEQCDAGWIADQTVRWAPLLPGYCTHRLPLHPSTSRQPSPVLSCPRYPIHTPREACYGDMNGFPGVRNYGVVDPEDMYDVYCYAEDLPGEIFLETAPDKFTLEEAAARCRALGAELASTGQLYAAWSAGLDACSPGWLADGSVRYPIVTPRERCGGALPGVKTIFLFRNQTGFPDAQSRYDAYCFREGTNSFPEAAGKYQAREPEGFQEIVTVAEKLEELQLPKAQVEIESRGAIYAIPFFKDAELEKPSLSPEDAPGPGARHPPLDTSVSSGHPTSATPFPMALAIPEAGIPLSCGAKLGSSSPAEEDGATGTAGQCTAAGHKPSGMQEEQGAALGRDPGSISAESLDRGQDHSQPMEPDEAASTEMLSMAPRVGTEELTGTPSPAGTTEGDMEPPEGFPRPPSPTASTRRPDRPWDAMGRPAHTASPGAPGHRVTLPTSATSATSSDSRESGGMSPRGHKSSGVSTPIPAAEDAEISGDVVESPGASPLPPAPSQPQEEGEEQSGALWLPSPTTLGDGSTVPMAEVTAVTPWDTEVPGSSSMPATGGEEAVPRLPSTDRGMPAASLEEEEEEEDRPAPSVATVEGFLAAIPGEPGGCVPNPCLNGGTCMEDSAHLACLCLPGYGGSSCERLLEKCSPGWDSFQGACYKHFSTRRSWEDAETQCRHYGGHLATILTPEEQDFINDQYREYQWIGLNDRTIEGDFQWSDGSPLLYENWHRGQPDSYFLSGENCVVIVWHDGGQWSDVPCNYHLSYTCKMGLVQCGPPPAISNAHAFGKPKQRYEIGSITRYQCRQGFVPRRSPIIRCQEDGMWEPPQLACRPGLAQPPDD
ncbi:brevican core protein isoform 6-T6 [Morphnus guianensis]